MVILWMYYFSKVQIASKGLKIVLGAILYGIVMEICQAVFTTYRSADIVDVIANSSGAISGFFLYKTITWNFFWFLINCYLNFLFGKLT